MSEPAAALDDCWNRIGVFGVKSCHRLPAHIHCRNCEAYRAAAVRVLDGCAVDLQDEPPSTTLPAEPQEAGERRSMLVFRLGDEWLALPTSCVEEVLPLAPVHRLPHLRSRALLGVANLHGALVACVALPHLLGLEDSPAASAPREKQSRVLPRLLSLAGPGGALLAPVDEVDGIHLVAQSAVRASSRAGAPGLDPMIFGVTQRNGRSISLIDGERLQQALARSFH